LIHVKFNNTVWYWGSNWIHVFTHKYYSHHILIGVCVLQEKNYGLLAQSSEDVIHMPSTVYSQYVQGFFTKRVATNALTYYKGLHLCGLSMQLQRILNLISPQNSELNHLNQSINDTTADDDSTAAGSYYALLVNNIVNYCLNLIGNIDVLIFICKRWLLGHTTNVFIVSLAMADALCSFWAISYNDHLAIGKSMSVYLCKTYLYALCVFRTAVAYTVILLTTETILNILHPSRFITAGRCLFFITLVWFFLDSLLYMCGVVLYDIRQWHDYSWRIIIRIWPNNVWKIVLLFTSFEFITHGISVIRLVHFVHFAIPCSCSRVPCYRQKAAWLNQTKIWDFLCKLNAFHFLHICCIHALSHSLWNDGKNTFYEISTTIYYTRGLFFLWFIYTLNKTCAEETSWRTQITRHSWICLTDDTVVVFH